MDPNDLDLFNKFLPSSGADPILQAPTDQNAEHGQSTNLADLILEKIAAHEAAQTGERVIIGGGAPEDAVEMNPKVVQVYST